MRILRYLTLISLLALFLTDKDTFSQTICFNRDDVIVCYRKDEKIGTKYKSTDKTHIEKIIREKAKEIGVDPDLAVKIAYYESRLNQSAISSKGAIGVMQIMPQTARELGINPYDLYQNIEGGLRYFKILLDRFNNDLHLALAAYNAGPNNVERYGGIPPFGETVKYVANITGDNKVSRYIGNRSLKSQINKGGSIEKSRIIPTPPKILLSDDEILITNRVR